jgi:ABC-type Zn uptake system ZnuABC Zn-binding protein ZnuA
MSTRSEKLAELREVQQGQIQLAKYYLSFKSPEERERQQKEANRLRDNAQKIITQAERIEQAIASWQTGYIAATERVAELRIEIINLENEDKIARLEELVDKMKELNNVE